MFGVSQTVIAADVIDPLMEGYNPKTSSIVEPTNPDLSLDKYKEYQAKLNEVATKTEENKAVRNQIRDLSIEQFSSETSPEREREKEIELLLPSLRAKNTENLAAIASAQEQADNITNTWKSLFNKNEEKFNLFKEKMAILADTSSDEAAKQNAQTAINSLLPKVNYISDKDVDVDVDVDLDKDKATGTPPQLHKIKHVAAGKEDTDAVNVAQLKQAETHYFSINADEKEKGEDSNYDNRGAIYNSKNGLQNSKNAMAIGVKAKATSESSIAIGTESLAGTECYDNNCGGSDVSSIAIGYGAKSLNNGTISIGDKAIAEQTGGISIGRSSFASEQAVAIGQNAQVKTSSSSAIAIGDHALVERGSAESVALGYETKVTKDRALALGYQANANISEGMALGSRSKTEIDKGQFGYHPAGKNIEAIRGSMAESEYEQVLTNLKDEVNKLRDNEKSLKEKEDKLADSTITSEERTTLTNEINTLKEKITKNKENITERKNKIKDITSWQSTAAGVSVGNSELGITRQINNLAAGTKDTDAVNVAQLKALANAPVSFYNKGSDTALGNATLLPLNNLNINFTDGLKAEIKTVENKKVLFVGLDKTSLQNDPAFKGEKGDTGLTGKDGKDGKNGQDGQSAEIVMDNQDSNLKIIHQTLGGKKQVKINLNKDIKNLNSVSSKEFKSGETVMNEKGVTIGSGDSQVSLTEKGLNNGGNRIVNVASGVNPMDAVNKAQLDQAECNIQRRIDKVGKKADAGTASAIAQGSIPQVSASGKMGIGIGSGFYGNQSSISLGASRMTDNGKWIFKGSFSSNTQGKVGVGAGAMYQW